jgi:transcriptional regulator with XRE-family HTH domain
MNQFQSPQIKSVIKSLLKKKALSYEDVAEKLECSVPTVKRILGAEELSLNRLLQLCDILSIDLGELQTLLGEGEKQEEKFTPEQEIFLAKNRAHFAYLMKLFDGKTPKQIAEEFKLTARSIDKYLIALEKNELIKVTSGGKVKPAFKAVPTFGRGILAKVYFEDFIQSGANFFTRFIHESLLSRDKDEKPKSSGKFVLNGMRMTQATYDLWTLEQDKSFHELSKRASFEEKTKDAGELMTAVVMTAHALVENDYAGLKPLDTAVGVIENL